VPLAPVANDTRFKAAWAGGGTTNVHSGASLDLLVTEAVRARWSQQLSWWKP